VRNLPQRPSLERALVLADRALLAELLRSDRTAATAPRGRVGAAAGVAAPVERRPGGRAGLCAAAARRGVDPNSQTTEWGGESQLTAVFSAVERRDFEVVDDLRARVVRRCSWPRSRISSLVGRWSSRPGTYEFRLTATDGTVSTVKARYTYVYERDARGQWKIVHHHSSKYPKS
jgi:hypothetical protein